jgi:hypothetical protein
MTLVCLHLLDFQEKLESLLWVKGNRQLLAECEVRHLTAMCLRHVAAAHLLTVLQPIRNQSEQQSKVLSRSTFDVCTNSQVLVLSACSIITVFHITPQPDMISCWPTALVAA